MKYSINIYLLVAMFFLNSCTKKSLANSSTMVKYDIPFKQDVYNLLQQACNCDIAIDVNIQPNNKTNSYILRNNTLTISSPSIEEASITAYTVLDKLGFRFYGPTDHWSYIPSLKKKSLDLSGSINIPFEINHISVSYAFGPNKIKELLPARKQWKKWYNRLRFSHRVKMSRSHYGFEFNKKYKEQILANPSWTPKGKNFNPRNGKLCYTEPGVVELYKKDAEERLRKLIQTSQPPYYINMEPTDGRGHCYTTSQEISDAVFGLANEVAKHIIQIHPEAKVNMHSYNDHAIPPSFPLEPNVLVAIVPDLFQRDKTPKQLRKDWESFHNNLYYRSYMSLPAASRDTPSPWNSKKYTQVVQHLKNSNDYLGYHFESSPSFFVSGWNFYSVSQITYNEFDSDIEYQLFLERMFPNETLKRLFEVLLTSRAEVYMEDLISQLQLQKKQTNNIELQKRLDDMIIYAQYRLAYYQHKSSSSAKTKNDLLKLIYDDSGKLNIHSYSLYKIFTKAKAMDYGKLPPSNLKQTSKKAVQLTLPNSLSSITKSELVPLNKYWKEPSYSSQVLSLRKHFRGTFYHSSISQPVQFKIQATKFQSKAIGEIIVTAPDGTKHRKPLVYDDKSHVYTFNLSQQGTYKVALYKLHGTAKMSLPNIPFAIQTNLNGFRQKKIQSYYLYSKNNKIAINLPNKVGTFTVKTYPENEIIYQIKNNKINNNIVQFELPKPGIYKIESDRNSFQIVSEPHLISLSPNAVWLNN